MMVQHRYLKDVATLALNSGKCIGCGRCAEVCPHGVFEIIAVPLEINCKEEAEAAGNSAFSDLKTVSKKWNSFIERKAVITDKDLCMECGACALNCPTNAITVNAGVGCAAAIIKSWITGGEPSCDCSGDSGGCC